jgi:hypothetical protein
MVAGARLKLREALATAWGTTPSKPTPDGGVTDLQARKPAEFRVIRALFFAPGCSSLLRTFLLSPLFTEVPRETV